MLYVLFVRVFNTAFKKWYYLLPLGWGKYSNVWFQEIYCSHASIYAGLPLPVVALSVGLRHHYYGTATL